MTCSVGWKVQPLCFVFAAMSIAVCLGCSSSAMVIQSELRFIVQLCIAVGKASAKGGKKRRSEKHRWRTGQGVAYLARL